MSTVYATDQALIEEDSLIPDGFQYCGCVSKESHDLAMLHDNNVQSFFWELKYNFNFNPKVINTQPTKYIFYKYKGPVLNAENIKADMGE